MASATGSRGRRQRRGRDARNHHRSGARKRSRVAKAAVEASRIVARGVARWMKAAGLSKWTGAVRGDREAESEEEEEKEEAEEEEEEEKLGRRRT